MLSVSVTMLFNYSHVCIGDASLTSNAEQPCPDDIVVFTCTVSGVDLFFTVLDSNNVFVTQFMIDDRSVVNMPEEMFGFTSILQSRTPSGDSTAILTTIASAQIDGYIVVCTTPGAPGEVGRMTIRLSGRVYRNTRT